MAANFVAGVALLFVAATAVFVDDQRIARGTSSADWASSPALFHRSVPFDVLLGCLSLIRLADSRLRSGSFSRGRTATPIRGRERSVRRTY